MALYAQQADVESYIEGWTTTDPFALERLIRRAESDIQWTLTRAGTPSVPYQVISLKNATGGTFVIQWNGIHPASTGALVFNAPVGVVQAALAGITDIGASYVTVLGGPPIYTVVWDATWAETYGDAGVPLLTVDESGLTATTPPVEVTVDVARSLRINPLLLDQDRRISLTNATCAQVEYRNAMGGRFFVRSQFASVRGPDFTTQGKLPTLGPKVRRELAGTGLLIRGGRAVASYGAAGVRRLSSF